jgi:hypothetical protein
MPAPNVKHVPLFCSMYTRQEASQIRKKFWTSFGQYMRPLTGATGDAINWLNYKTGIKHIYFRLDADQTKASVSIELAHPDALLRHEHFNCLKQLKNILEELTGEPWIWSTDHKDEDGNIISRVGIVLNDVNVFDESKWPAIISFLKPRIIALDEFWNLVKDRFE